MESSLTPISPSLPPIPPSHLIHHQVLLIFLLKFIEPLHFFLYHHPQAHPHFRFLGICLYSHGNFSTVHHMFYLLWRPSGFFTNHTCSCQSSGVKHFCPFPRLPLQLGLYLVPLPYSTSHSSFSALEGLGFWIFAHFIFFVWNVLFFIPIALSSNLASQTALTRAAPVKGIHNTVSLL